MPTYDAKSPLPIHPHGRIFLNCTHYLGMLILAQPVPCETVEQARCGPRPAGDVDLSAE